MVVYPRQHHGYLRLLLLQLLLVRLGLRSGLCALPLEDPLVRARWLAELGLFCRRCVGRIYLEALGKQQKIRHE